MASWIALTRAVSPSLEHCELTHLAREPINVARAQAQHMQYEAALAELGGKVVHLPAAPKLPDAVFVEDTALVLDELAIITRPGAASRRPETQAVAHALQAYRPLSFIEAPGTLDGGDILRVGRRLFVGLTTRSNAAGIAQLRQLVAPAGCTVEGVEVKDCLHLKSAVSVVAPDTLLLNPAWVDAQVFGVPKVIEVDPREPFGANALWLDEALIYPQAYIHTQARLRAHGLNLKLVEADELAKAEGGVTCCSLIVKDISRAM